uniref:Myb-binding protein 1A-like protein-like n=1 Tax=Saccoglossus kowalevskii TaxID=10224 RepID=A0ABM0GJH1_SACKO|nr:PREDICTED: myb-binding protein 1A-like protein-like [Saccoglossus kowalevskii]
MAVHGEHVAGDSGPSLQDRQLLDTFWELASPKDGKRVAGAQKLVEIIVKKQKEHTTRKNETQNDDYCKELSYTLSRLVKGLASSRKGARQGYAMALSEILQSNSEVKVEDILDLIEEHLEIKGRKQDERCCAFGQLFAFLAIVQSGRVFQAPDQYLEKLITELYRLSHIKPYLNDVCTQAMIDIIKQCQVEDFQKYAWPVIKEELQKGWEKCTPGRLQLLLICRKSFPHAVKSKFLKSHWSRKDITHEENLNHIAHVLEESTINSHPNIHSVCRELLMLYSEDSDKLIIFWDHVVDKVLCNSTYERKYLSFKLLELTVTLVDANDMSGIFSHDLVRCIMNSLVNKQTFLHEAAKELLLSLVRNYNLPRDATWLLDCTKFLLTHAFFTVTKADKTIPECNAVLEDAVSEPIKKLCCQYFFSALNCLSNISSSDAEGSYPRLLGMMNDCEFYVYRVVMFVEQLLTNEHVDQVEPFSTEVRECWDGIITAVQKLHKKTSKDKKLSEAYAFQLLYLHIGLQLFTDSTQAMDIVQELHDCEKKALQKRRSVRKKDEPEWIEVVTEILLSLLSQSSHLIRIVVDNVFKIICPHMTKEALQLLLDVLDPKKSSDSESNLQIKRDSEEEEDVDDVEEQTNGNHGDVGDEEEGSKGEEESDEEKEEEEEEEDEEEEEEEEPVGEVDEELRSKLMAVLGDAAIRPDEDSDSGSENSDMSDSQMFKLDDALAEAFKEKLKAKNMKKEKIQAKKMMIHFKLRVLDLLDIFIKRQPANPLVLSLLHPLLLTIKPALNRKEENVLAEKASALYKNKLCRMRKYPHSIHEKCEDLHQDIEDFIQLVYKAPSVHFVSLVSAGTLFMMRVLKGNTAVQEPSPVKTRSHRENKNKQSKSKDTGDNKEILGILDVRRVIALYRNALNDFLSKRQSRLHPVLFTELIERLPELGWYLADLLVKYVKDGVQLYRKIQASKMLAMLMSRSAFTDSSMSWAEFSTAVSSTVQEIIINTIEDESNAKPKYLLELLRMMQIFVNLTYTVNKESRCRETWTDFPTLLEKLALTTLVSKSSEIKIAVAALQKAMLGSDEVKHRGRKRKRKKQKHRAKTGGAIANGNSE